MPAPLAAALGIVARYAAKKGVAKAVKKYGKQAVDKAVRGGKKLADKANQKSKTGNFKGRRTPEKDMKQPIKKDKKGKTYSVMGRPQLLTRTARDAGGGLAIGMTASEVARKKGVSKGSNKNKEASKGSKFGDKKYVKHGGKNKANVTKEELKKSGLTLTQYMNKWNKSGKRP